MEVHCLLAMKIVRHHANGRLDWLISGHQSVNPLREAMSGKCKRFTFVHPVRAYTIIYHTMYLFLSRSNYVSNDMARNRKEATIFIEAHCYKKRIQ